MDTTLVEVLRLAGETGRYEFTLHADDERLDDMLTRRDIDDVLTSCELLEDYPEDKRGHSCLVLGFAKDGRPVHLVCAPKPGQRLIIITVYIPQMPKWSSPRSRNR